MFIELLTDEEKKVFLKLALDLEKVAEKRCERTQVKVNSFVSRIVKESGENVEELNVDLLSVEGIVAKRVILFELISIAYASGDYDNEEKAYINEIANKFKLDSKELEEIENYVLDFVSYVKKVKSLINK